MQYLGGKYRTWKEIARFLRALRSEKQVYFEPFVGGAWVLQGMYGERIASDLNEALITMWKSLQNGWIQPSELQEWEYQHLKETQDPCNPLTAFAGFGCSFSGKWFGGYAKNNRGDDYIRNSRNSLVEIVPFIKGVNFEFRDYREFSPSGMLIYCDPPYQGMTGYGAVGKFDNIQFWEVMRQWSKLNTVVISEYSAPQDFECVYEIDTKTELRTVNGRDNRTERLFMHESISVGNHQPRQTSMF